MTFKPFFVALAVAPSPVRQQRTYFCPKRAKRRQNITSARVNNSSLPKNGHQIRLFCIVEVLQGLWSSCLIAVRAEETEAVMMDEHLGARVQETWQNFARRYPDWAAMLSAPLGMFEAREAPQALANLIDHTALGAVVTEQVVRQLCQEALEYSFASVCVNPVWVPLAKECLDSSGVKVCTVVGFPLGANAPGVKAFEAARAVAQGADEIDMVLAIGPLKAGSCTQVRDDIGGVVAAADGNLVKVILETCFLDDDEKVIACWLARLAGAHYVKTSTGFGGAGATIRDVQLMRLAVGQTMGVKASGGIRDAKTACAMLQAGASRLGCSASVAIAQGQTGAGTY
jgi:deoxyribose-phosphate aldolase